MDRYKRAYYKMFVGLCDILDRIEEIEAEENISIECMEIFKEVEKSIKMVHIDGEEEVIR